MSTILVTGGLGYIGKIVVKELFNAGHNVIIMDIKNTIDNDNILKYSSFIYTGRDIKSPKDVFKIFIVHPIDAVVHLAGEISVGESQQNATKYYNNNIIGSINILDAMVCFCVKKIVFASSASVYGNSQVDKQLSEKLSTNPTNVYARTKLIIEQIMSDYKSIHGIDSTSLRFFNAAGADVDNEFGEDHEPEFHLIPNILNSSDITIFGNDYPTPDGTCVRDYVHITDLAKAIILSLGKFDLPIVNVGGGKTYSNLEVVKKVEELTGHKKNIKFGPRRSGDPSILQANISLAAKQLGFTPQYSDIDTIINTAFKWHTK